MQSKQNSYVSLYFSCCSRVCSPHQTTPQSYEYFLSTSNTSESSWSSSSMLYAQQTHQSPDSIPQEAETHSVPSQLVGATITSIAMSKAVFPSASFAFLRPKEISARLATWVRRTPTLPFVCRYPHGPGRADRTFRRPPQEVSPSRRHRRA